MKKLTVMSLNALKTEGLHRDPETTGLYVQVTFKRHGNERSAEHGVVRSWAYRFKSPVTGKARCMGLGSCDCVTIHEARELARAARKIVTFGGDPIEQRIAKQVAERQAYLQEQASRMTFRQCVEQAVPGMVANSRNDKHQRQFKASLLKACESFGDVSVAAIDSAMITKFLTPMWNATPTTADRLRNRIERVLDWAKAKGFRTGDNPAAWKGNLEHALFTKPDKKQRHHEALPYADLPAFMVRLRERNTTIARALEFCILTAARSNEVRNAKWTDIDLSKRLWVVPAEAMKRGLAHTVPLSDAAMPLLAGLDQSTTYVFPGRDGGQFNDTALGDTLKAIGVPVTTHGFRSTFSDWAHDRATFDHETIEHSLAHGVGSKVAQAYRRGTGLEKRVKLMEAWANFCDGTAEADNVVKLHG
jgi:integrase